MLQANKRSNQENLFADPKTDMRALSTQADTLLCNRAYMVMASLPWSDGPLTAKKLPLVRMV